ncbi:MAG: CarD family transcriptional regulator [Bacillota bacterium]|nr:CarD family transcriptional regulator [Bacillota bacterium]
MFTIGQKVVYPVHGAGVIESIENREVMGEIRSYFVLKLYTGELRVLIPVDTVEKAGMRCVCDQHKLHEVEDILRQQCSAWDENWNRRYRMNMEKIKSGDICQLAEVVRNLSLRDCAKGLSAGEKKMLDNARKILLSEVVLATDRPYAEAQADLEKIFVQKTD